MNRDLATAPPLALAMCAVWMLAGCQATVEPKPADAPPALAAQASSFMIAYAHDLLAGDRTSLAARYHPDGAYIVGEGDMAFEPHADTVAFYAQDWRPPAAFEWHDLSFELVGDGVVVIGTFEWWEASRTEPEIVSYSALLLPVNGELKIRLEDESRSRIAPHGP